ncbi:MAG TPA: tyrosine-type recombinase/integrase [Acidimicrobiales bacterium]|nr:tyrosine-type recombinase/integrase [Acidimicrobiales bacterium]
MRGSVVRKGGRWYVKIELDPDPTTGSRRQKWHSGYRTRRDAERARIDLLSKFDRGEYVEPSQQPLGQFLTEWLQTIEPTVRPSTFDSYRRNIFLHVIPRIGGVRLTKADAGVLNGLYAQLLTSGRLPSSRAGQGYSAAVLDRARTLREQGATLEATARTLRNELPEAAHITKDTLASLLRRSTSRMDRDAVKGLDRRTVNYIHTILHRAFKDAVRWGRLVRNPASAADPPRSTKKPEAAQAWDAATLRLFLDASRVRQDPLHALWVLIATTGMRRGEALGLRWSDVDISAGRCRIIQTVIQVRSAVSISEPKTSTGRRSISLDSATVAVLREHRRRMREQRLLVGSGFTDNDLVFHHPDGACLHPESVSAMFLRRVQRQGLPRLTVHGLRHTWATLALEQGVHPRVVQERLGHANIAITLDIYSHVSPTLHDEAAELVAGLVMPPLGGPARA